MKIMVLKRLAVCICLVLLLNTLPGSVQGQNKYLPEWSSLDTRPVPQWFSDAKFGIFIHWGVYSVPAWAPVGKDFAVYSKYSEWYWNRLVTDSSKVGKAFRTFHYNTYGPNVKYQDFAPLFKAELYDPAQWAAIFKNSGARYVVLTSKHHDGYALWPSAEAWNWNAMDVGPHRDLAGDLVKAVKAEGLHMGFYYSLYEWFNPLYKNDKKKYVAEHMIPQLKDLVNRYHPDVIWPDGEWELPSSEWKSQEFLAWLYNESPVRDSVVVNDRWGKETRSKHGGFYTTEYDILHNESSLNTTFDHPWEECRGIGGSFGYNRNENLQDYQSSDALIRMLIEKVARGGNLLLDIGPDADGRIPVIMQQRLSDMGKWLAVNGEAIYASTQAPRDIVQGTASGIFTTRKNRDLYVFVCAADVQSISLKLPGSPASVRVLGQQQQPVKKYRKGILKLDQLQLNPNLPDGGYAWVIKLENVFD